MQGNLHTVFSALNHLTRQQMRRELMASLEDTRKEFPEDAQALEDAIEVLNDVDEEWKSINRSVK